MLEWSPGSSFDRGRRGIIVVIAAVVEGVVM